MNFVQNQTYDAASRRASGGRAPQPAGADPARRGAGAVCLAMAAIVSVSIFNPFRMLLPKLPVDIGNLVVSGTKITMENPHLAGFSADRRPYELWAKAAIQDLNDPDHVELARCAPR